MKNISHFRLYRSNRLILLLYVGLLGSTTIYCSDTQALDKSDTHLLHINPNKEMNGIVKDPEGNPLAGVTIKLKNTRIGTLTNDAGLFHLTVPDTGTLVVSFVGYETQEVAVAKINKITITLHPSSSGLEEVVVVGYGTQKKSDLTGSISVLRSDDFNQGAISSVGQLIAGKASGVQVVQNSAAPGGGISVNIRGVGSINAGNSPLYVVDGMPLDNSHAVSGGGEGYVGTRAPRNPLSFINPADIQSIEVLKDASATAIYGARGANGVVLITTKTGATGGLKVDYEGYAGVQRVAHKLHLLNPKQYMEVTNDIIDNGGGDASQKVTTVRNGGTDWQDAIFQNNALVQNHNISLSGGTAHTTYRASFNYFGQNGIIKSSAFERWGVSGSLRHTIPGKFNFGLNLSVNYISDDYVPASGFGVNEHAGVIYTAIQSDPTLPIRDSTGQYVRSDFINMDNPIALINGMNATANRYHSFGIAYAEYFILPSLSFKFNIGGDVNNVRRDSYLKSYTLKGRELNGIATVLNGTKSNYLLQGTLNYNKTFGSHHLTGLLGTTTEKYILNRVTTSANGFSSDATGTDNLGLADPASYKSTSGKSTNRLLSYLGRINYSYKNKYLLTASYRIDGSSRFGSNTKFGYFPSLAIGWKMDQEDFFSTLKSTINTFKIRASWGRTGNQDIGNYRSLTTFSSGWLAVFDGTRVATLHPSRLANPDLKWETNEQLNVGVDFGLFNDRISGSMDWYRKNTFDMLLDLPIPTSTGFNSRLENIGGMKNTGFELALQTDNIKGTAFQWHTQITLTTMHNEVTSLGGIPQIITGSAGATSQISIIKEGLPLNAFYGYDIIGIWQKGDDKSETHDPVVPGDFKYRDVNGDGTVDADDRVILGNSFPDVMWSLGNTFRYNGFSLYVFLQAVHGADMLNENLVQTYFPAGIRRNRLAEPLLNRWTDNHPSNQYPSFVNLGHLGNKQVNSYTVEDASYIKLQTVKLSYQIPLKTNFIRAASVFVTGENLITWTDYIGYDPAVNPNGDANFKIDYNPYPPSRTFLFGLSIKF